MSRSRKVALAGGGLYLLTFVASLPALFLINPVLSNANYVISGGADTRVIWGCFLDMINALAAAGTAAALYPVVRRKSEGLALGFLVSRIFEMAVIMIGVVSLLAVVTLRRGGVAGGEAESLVIAGRSLVAVRDWTFLLGPGFICGINALLLGTLMYRSRLVPRWIPVTGLVGAPFFLAASIITSLLAGDPQTTVWRAVSTAPIFVWEFSLGLYLVMKGFKPTPITTEFDAVA
jgi:hypothetical protein